MASTEQIRKWYHKGVVLNHALRGTPGYHPHCDHNHPKVAFPNQSGGFYNEPVHPLTFEAWTAYTTVMKAMGIKMSSAGGVNSCRNIFDTDDPSLHAYLCACDLPPNNYKPTAFLVAIEDIRCNNRAKVFHNLSGDRMHDQINCSPADLATGIDWTTVAGDGDPIGDDDVETIKAIQKQCNAGGFKGANGRALTVDGLLGPNTQFAMNALAVAASAEGTKGDTGDRGAKGATGARGLAGAKGATGPSGKLTIEGTQTIP